MSNWKNQSKLQLLQGRNSFFYNLLLFGWLGSQGSWRSVGWVKKVWIVKELGSFGGVERVGRVGGIIEVGKVGGVEMS